MLVLLELYFFIAKSKIIIINVVQSLYLREKRIFDDALFVPNATVIITLSKHLALLVVIDHDATLAVNSRQYH